MRHDVLIVGAGPGGIAAAITCLKAGLKVALNYRPVNAPPAGVNPVQSIHPGVVSLLENLGLAEAVAAASRGTFSGISVNGSFQVLGQNGETWYGHHLDRVKFDAFLATYIQSQSVTLISDDEIETIETLENGSGLSVQTASGKSLEADFLIDASGHRRKIGRLLKFKELTLSPSMTCWTGVSEYPAGKIRTNPTTEFIGRNDGWLWLAPESGSRFTWTRLIVDKQSAFENPFPDLEHQGQVEAYNVRWRVFRPVCNERVLLCGDAAGILDPAAGQGILNALMSGIMAGKTVVSMLQNPPLEQLLMAQYDQWFINQFEQKVKMLNQYYLETMGIEVNSQLDESNTI